MRSRTSLTLDITAATIATGSIPVALPDGYAAQVRGVHFLTSSPIATVGFNDLFLVVASKPVVVTLISAANINKTSFLYGANIVNTGPGQSNVKNLAMIPTGELFNLAPVEESNCPDGNIYVGLGAPATKATGPTATVAVIVEFELVRITNAMAAAFAVQTT